MFMRILIAGAALVALAVPPAQAGPLFNLFKGCSFGVMTQCAKNITHGNGNKAKIYQDQWDAGFQFGFQIQDGNGNSATTRQKGTDQFALTFQKGDNNQAYTGQNGKDDFAVTAQIGDNNTAGTHQQGTSLAAVTVQSGNGMWSSTGMSGDGGVSIGVQSN